MNKTKSGAELSPIGNKKIICNKCDKDSGYTEKNITDMIADDKWDLVCDPCANILGH